MGAKAHRPNMSPPDRNRKPYKKTNDYFSFFLSFISVMSLFVRTTPGHPSHHFFTRFQRSLPLGRIQHHTRQQCLPLCVIFSTTRYGRVCLWVILIVIVQYDSVCLSVPTSPSHKMAVFASSSHANHHTSW